ncbi:MAG: 50S ribosomal protein L18 [Bacteroidetes bacterium RIFOXYA12_FULL_35_11]|nr:MAG: 50S ribosomal protein L18 [Bacteroidetes bacterium GWF2_35_48]OFY79583.1 MAG: 50S ribosomal protein L18 [Bacteroidetes bacterium RIFOXYA12_FULL_35_11]OFY93129.1 MAG: 50S ribosomal protein L18 [Bacteroidetes bacterium RIFOXYC12_FULL_35_7]OFY96085.1 MAG: 50S ribosomal protein L18 [Bacteroidetes bacterium RIFOXYB2_FULL_35_7]HBX50534.1 50S ribosomal protein L18 [Bacteroidales bacterium]
MSLTKKDRRDRIKHRIRKVITGSAGQPRMTVFRSNKQISVQLIDDLNGATILSTSSLCKDISENKGIKKIEQAALVGKKIAALALEKGISTVVFDRNGYLYHGRVKSLADAAREGGLKF